MKRARVTVALEQVYDTKLRKSVACWRIRVNGEPTDGSEHPPTWAPKVTVVHSASLLCKRAAYVDRSASELFIFKRNGQIQDRRTYPRSSDPRRSKG